MDGTSPPAYESVKIVFLASARRAAGYQVEDPIIRPPRREDSSPGDDLARFGVASE